MSREYMRAQSISFFTNRMMHAKININIGKVPEIVHSWYALSNSWLFCLENFLLYLFLIILVIISCLTSKVVIFNHFPKFSIIHAIFLIHPLLLQYFYCLIWLINLLIKDIIFEQCNFI